MRKTILFIFVFAMLTLMLTTQLATADYLISNGSATEDAWVIYSTWREASGGWPAGWRTQGWRRVEPGGFTTLSVPEHNPWVYLRVERPYGREIKPPDHETRDAARFWIHPSKGFTAVMRSNGDFLKSDWPKWALSRARLYKYPNGGRHTITDRLGNLPELSAQQIYNQAINSVLWIITPDERSGGVGLGSGVLIDKERQLAVTNAHVTAHAEWVDVFFPKRDRNGNLIKNQEYYVNNRWRLESLGYATQGRVIAENFRSDLAIIQLDRLPPTAREIAHDFGLQIEASMKRGDKVHILGNPGNRMWNWTQGSFVRDWGSWLEMEGDGEGGNSGGPVLNTQGLLIGILSGGTDETLAGAVPARDVKALLDTVFPRHTFEIKNTTPFTVVYQIKWSENDAWQRHSLRSNRGLFHWWSGNNVPWGYPKIRFDSIPGDGQVTPLVYQLPPFLRYFGFNYRDKIIPGDAHAYFFEFDAWTGRLDVLAEDAALAPALSKTIPKATALLPNYPNPFNPETWVPYQLAAEADVTLTIYAVDGTLVRTLALGHRAAGVYQSKSRAAYWDGRNELGEPVASGIYFYTLTAGDFSATGKMLVRK